MPICSRTNLIAKITQVVVYEIILPAASVIKEKLIFWVPIPAKLDYREKGNCKVE